MVAATLLKLEGAKNLRLNSLFILMVQRNNIPLMVSWLFCNS